MQEAQRRASYTYPVFKDHPSEAQIGEHKRGVLLIGPLLAVGLLCLIPSVVLLSHVLRLKPNKSGGKGLFVSLRPWINRIIRVINQSWLGKLFSLDEQYRDNGERSIFLCACCVSLLMIPLFISVVSLLPAWINFGPAVPWEGGLWQYILTSLAYGMFFLTLFFLLIIIAGGLWFSAFTVLPRLNLSLWSRWLAFFSTVISFLMFVWACRALYQVVTNIKTSPLEAFFFFLRTIELGSGVSLLLPWVFIWLAAFLFFFSIVRRLDLAERACDLALHFATPLCVSLTAREGQARSSFTGLTELEDRVKDLLTCSIFTVPGASLMIVFIGAPYLHRFVAHRIPSLEGEWFDLFFRMAFYVVPLWLAWVFLQLFSLALRLRRFLQRLGWHPLFNAPIDVQDPAFQMLPKLSLMSSMPTDAALSSSLTLAQEFLRLLNKAAEHQGFSVWPIPCMKTLWSEVEQAERQLQQALDHEAHRRWREALAPRRAAQKAMSKASRAIAAWMEPHWTALHDQSSPHRHLLTQGRLCLISHVTAFLQHPLVHLQSLAGLVTTGLLLLLMAVTSYPFQPHEPLLLFGWITSISWEI